MTSRCGTSTRARRSTSDQQVELGPDAWSGTVELTYRYDGFDEPPARIETSVVFVPDRRRRADRRPSAAADERTPLWLADRLSVVRTPRTLLAVAARRAGRYPGLVTARRAPGLARAAGLEGAAGWSRCPSRASELDAALEAEPGEYDNIAAVTTTADGSLAPGAPVRVFVNPAVFGRLKERGAQVVMSHETTHVATGRHLRRRCPPGCSRASPTSSRSTTPASRSTSRPRQILDAHPQGGAARRAADEPATSTPPPTGSARPTRRRGWPAASSPRSTATEQLVRVLPRGQRRAPRRQAGLPERARHHAAGVRGALARRPGPPCRGGTLNA